MKVAIDGFEWRDRPTGVGRFMKNLLSVLIPAAPSDQFVLIVPAPLQDPPSWPNLTVLVSPFDGGYFRWQNAVLPGLIRRHGCDRLLAPNNLPPLRPGVPTLVVVHDISWRFTPRDFSWKQQLSHHLRASWGLKRTKAISAVSAFSASEIERWYGIDQSRIQVIHHGLQPGLKCSSPQDISSFKAAHNLNGKTVIGFLGALFGRRHIRELIQAVQLLRKSRDAILLLAGPDRLKPTERVNLDQKWIIRLPWLPEEDIPLFYSSLHLSAYLSDYEGFGLPPMEALQCGTVPLLLSGSSLSELYTGAALFIQRPDPIEIATAMTAFLDQPKIREHLLTAWQERESRFSWATAAQSYVDLLRTLE